MSEGTEIVPAGWVDQSLLVQFSQSLTPNHRSNLTWVWHEHISVELLKARSVGFVLALCFHGG